MKSFSEGVGIHLTAHSRREETVESQKTFTVGNVLYFKTLEVQVEPFGTEES